MFEQLRTYLFENPVFGIRIAETLAIILFILLLRRLILWRITQRSDDHAQICLSRI